jgi:GT2 family glycosyltransferase
VKTKDRVVAVVINRDGRAHLKRCLERLQRADPGCTSVVVVDDASSDGSAQAVRRWFPRVNVVVSPQRVGPAGARNLGIDHAESRLDFEHYLFLDNDAFLELGAVGEMLACAAAEPRVGIVTPKAYASLDDGVLHLAGEITVNLAASRVTAVGAGELDAGQYDSERDVQTCSGFAMLVRRTVIQSVGRFDEAFFPPAWEDVDFSLRVRRAGYRIRYAPSAVVEHVGGRLGRGLRAEREVAKLRNWVRLVRKHGGWLDKLAVLGTLPLRSVLLAGDRLRHRHEWMHARGIAELFQTLRSHRSRGGANGD